MKKILSTLLALCMVLTMLPFSGLSAFAETSEDFEYEKLNNSTAILTKYTGNASSVIIPESIDGYIITSISNHAFSQNKTLQSITLPDTINSIEEMAFYFCTALENIYVFESNLYFSTVNGVLFNKSKSELIKYPDDKKETEYTIPSEVRTIGKYAFNDCVWLENVLIPNGVTHICAYAFADCSRLKQIQLPSTVQIIETCAFYRCNKMASVTLPKNIISIGKNAFGRGNSVDNDVTIIYEGTHNEWYQKNISDIGSEEYNFSFDGYRYKVVDNTCTITKYTGSESNLIIPSKIDGCTVTKIGFNAFGLCTSIKSIIVPDSITLIDDYAFYYCTSLVDLTIGSGVTTICYNAFLNCISLENITIKNGMVSIRRKTFHDCTALKSIKIPNSVVSIEDYAFDGCVSLTDVPIPQSVTNIGNYVFHNCTSLKSIVIPDSVKNIGTYVFSGCNSLTNVTLPNNLKSISAGLFHDCTVLANVLIPNSVTSIESYAFWNCIALSKIVIPDGVISIKDYAFRDCTSLTSIIIPNSITSIGDTAFNGCTNLTIYGYRNSIAENYAKNHSIPFIALDAVELSSISIANQPSKKVYYIGDSLNTNGLQLKLTYSDGSTETVSSGYAISGFSSTTAGTKTVTVTYEGLTTTFNVTVNTPSISISPSSKIMTIGDTATLTATTAPSGQSVSWTSSNTSVASVSNGVVTAKASGTTTITAKFTYNGKTYSNTCKVTVNNPIATISSISIQSKPTKTIYTVGEKFDASGLKIKVTMSDGTTKTVTSGFTVSSPDMTTAGTKTVTVTYQGKITSFNITVNKPVSPTAAKYQISGAKAVAGSTVEIYVSIENNPGIISLRNKITYDTSVLELVKVEDLKLLSGYTTPSPIVDSPYILRWADSLATENNHANGNFVKLTFKIKDDAQAGDYGISVSHIESRTATGEKVEFADCGAVITVIDYIPGDVDGNGIVDDWDAIVLNRYLAGWKTEANLAASDIDGNGEIDDWDAIALERKLAGWN